MSRNPAKATDVRRPVGFGRIAVQRTPRKTPKKRAPVRGSKGSTAPRRKPRTWSQAVTEHSHALDLEPGVFTRTPIGIARSLKRSADSSTRRKASPFQSAMSMLTFYLNRAGRNLSTERVRALEKAKIELRRLYARDESSAGGA